MVGHKLGEAIADHVNFLATIGHKDTDEPVDESFILYLHQRLGRNYSLLGQSASFACCYNGISHIVNDFTLIWLQRYILFIY